MSLLLFLLILGVAVLVHEAAHYLNARSVGLPVRAFSVGMGPVLLRRTWGGTEWRLSLLPIGGYVDIPGMAAEMGEDGAWRPATSGFASKGLPAKLWVLVGGVLANFALGIVLVAATIALEPGVRTVTSGVQPDTSGARIVDVVPGSAAEALGLRAGDEFEAVNGVAEPAIDDLIAQIQGAEGLELTVARDGELVELSAPWPPEDAGDPPTLGVQLEPIVVEDLSVPFGTALVEAARFGVSVVPEAVRGFVRGVGGALSGRATEDIAGPVGMVAAVGQASRVGIGSLLFLAAVLNFSLAIFNLLPIPGLDGGRMLLATLVAVRGRPLRPGQEEAIHFAGIMAVLALMVLVTFQEIVGLASG